MASAARRCAALCPLVAVQAVAVGSPLPTHLAPPALLCRVQGGGTTPRDQCCGRSEPPCSVRGVCGEQLCGRPAADRVVPRARSARLPTWRPHRQPAALHVAACVMEPGCAALSPPPPAPCFCLLLLTPWHATHHTLTHVPVPAARRLPERGAVAVGPAGRGAGHLLPMRQRILLQLQGGGPPPCGLRDRTQVDGGLWAAAGLGCWQMGVQGLAPVCWLALS